MDARQTSGKISVVDYLFAEHSRLFANMSENLYDTALIVSGDEDFVPAIRKVQKLGKKVENAYFSVSRSDFLRKVCNSSILLDEIIEDCIKK